MKSAENNFFTIILTRSPGKGERGPRGENPSGDHRGNNTSSLCDDNAKLDHSLDSYLGRYLCLQMEQIKMRRLVGYYPQCI